MTYVLGLVVLIVWGMIIYRIFDAVSSSDDSPMTPTITHQKEAYNDYAIPKDTIRLLLNYRDPFGIIKPKDTVEIPIKKLIHKSGINLSAKPVFNWNFIQYAGYIRNADSKKLIALVTINGKNETFSEGEKKDNVKLIKNFRDSIKISFNGVTKFIAIKPAS